MSEPIVDVIIAVHNPQREIGRSVGSVLKNGTVPIRATVVSHNTESGTVRSRLGALADDHRLRFLTLNDGVPSPTGPFNAGMDAATAPFTSIIGSDDELQQGAIDSWVSVAKRDDADVVISRLELSSGQVVPTPPVRGARESSLHPVKDRLSYRSAPLGLVARERFADLRLTPGLRSGGDLGYVSRLWFSGARISFDRLGPAYIVHDDADDRVTTRLKTVTEEFSWLPILLQSGWARSLPANSRRSLTTKFIRRHLFGAIDNREAIASRHTSDALELAEVAHALIAFFPQVPATLSIAERRLLKTILDPQAGMDLIVDQARARRRFPRFATVFTHNPFSLLATDAPLPLALAHRRVLTSKQRSSSSAETSARP